MTYASRHLLAVLLALLVAAPVAAADNAPIERGTAILDPFALRALDQGWLGLNRLMKPSRSADAPLTNRNLFALPSMAPVRKALDEEFERYVGDHKARPPNDTIGVGDKFDYQLFDRALFDAPDARFILSGIVNRMDRAYVDGGHCGEVRLLYRMARVGAARIGELDASPRLPMTLNVVLKARGDHAVDGNGAPIDCAGIARRWLAAGELTLTGEELAAKLMAKDGPLDLIAPENIDRIETNLQIAHVPKSAGREFRTDYLMKVFDLDASSATYKEVVLENQIDRDRLLSDADFARDFKEWLLQPANFEALDRGTILIPDRFLKKGVIAPTPTGFAPSEMQPAFGLVEGEDRTDHPIFSESDVVSALQKEAERGVTVQNIRSAAGFERRLNDMSCGGCHQTRGIGGFHFPGVDWMAAKPDNTTVVPASPHFFGDQVRRRDIVTAMAEGRQPDFSRGFASRPQTRGDTELAGTEYEDGWGAHCYAGGEDASRNDKSFSGWTCAEGLSCQMMNPATRMGMCFIKAR